MRRHRLDGVFMITRAPTCLVRESSRQCRSHTDTCVAASKEAALEKALTKMEGNWADAEFGTKEWRTGRILAGIDEIQQELDDQIVKTQVLTQRLAVLRCLHAVDATRVHRTMPWVVSFSSLGPFRDRDAPRRPCTALAT